MAFEKYAKTIVMSRTSIARANTRANPLGPRLGKPDGFSRRELKIIFLK
jgi:hypothetical protein